MHCNSKKVALKIGVLSWLRRIFSKQGKKRRQLDSWRNELQWLSDEDKTTFQENNWDESTPQCPKQKNDSDCGVFTCFFAKHLLLSRGNHSSLTLNGEPRDKMVSDLLNLESALRAENDLPKVFQRTWQTASKLLTTENPLKTGWIKKWEMQDLLIPSPLPPKMATVCFMQCMTSYFVTEEHLRVPQNYAPTRWIISEVSSHPRWN